MKTEGNGAQELIPVWLPKEHWKAVSYSVAMDEYIGPKMGCEVEDTIRDAIEWAENDR